MLSYRLNRFLSKPTWSEGQTFYLTSTLLEFWNWREGSNGLLVFFVGSWKGTRTAGGPTRGNSTSPVCSGITKTQASRPSRESSLHTWGEMELHNLDVGSPSEAQLPGSELPCFLLPKVGWQGLLGLPKVRLGVRCMCVYLSVVKGSWVHRDGEGRICGLVPRQDPLASCTELCRNVLIGSFLSWEKLEIRVSTA